MNASTADYIELTVSSLVNFIPYILLAVYPFKNKLRFSKTVNIISAIVLTILQLVLAAFAMIIFPKHSFFFTVLDTLIFAVCYFVFIREKPGKLVFTFIMLTNFSSYILVVSTYIGNVIYRSTGVIPGHWMISLTTVIVQLIVLLPLTAYFTKYYIPAMNACYDAGWNYLWVIPATFYLVWHFTLYHIADCSSYEMALRPSTTVFLSLTTLCSCVIYHIAIMLINAQQARLKLEQEKRLWEMTSLQYRTINDRITESRIIRHDLRHHVTILQALLENKQYGELQELLARYGHKLSPSANLVFCENSTANLIIGFFAQQAKKLNIAFNANVNIPSDVPLESLEVGVLLANLLENAIDACKLSTADNKMISLSITMQGASMLVLSIQNTSTSKPLEPAGEFFHSTKHEGVGLGLTSVRRIVERHNGTLSIKQADYLFSLSFVLYLN